MLLTEGEEIERYRVVRLLGSGGQAEVWRVQHATLETAFALKVLSGSHPQLRDRLAQEGRVQASLRHPNVVSVFDTFQVRGRAALLMEFVDGPTLQERILAGGIDLGLALRIFDDILDGVEAAHARGLVHRDIKPSNVLLGGSAAAPVAKVSDFGLAKVLSDGENSDWTRSGAAMGTLCYMAPEQITSARTCDCRADVFALGCLLFELVAGTRPFYADNLIHYHSLVLARRRPDLRELRPEFPPGVATAIDGALEPDRERRIPDCATLREILAGRMAWESERVGIVRPLTTYTDVRDVATLPTPLSVDQPVPAALSPPAQIQPSVQIQPDPTAPGHGGRSLLPTVGVALAVVLFGIGTWTYWPRGTPAVPVELAPSGADLGVGAPEAAEAVASEQSFPGAEAADATVQALTTAPPPVATPAPSVVSKRVARASAEPSPVSGAPVPAPMAVVAVEVAPPPSVETVRWTAEGEYAVRLEGGGAVWTEGPTPEGTYLITADFGEGRSQAGSVRLESGREPHLVCKPAVGRCTAR